MPYEGAVRFTAYCLARMGERKLSREQVEVVLRSPDQDLPAKKGRRVAQCLTTSPKRGKRALIRVFYEEWGVERVVVNAYLTERPERYWEGDLP
jgi:hypothetical protein